METNSKGSEMLPGSQALQTLCREKDGLMERLSRGTALSVQPPAPPHDQDPEEDPAGLREDPGLRAPGILTEKLSPRKPLPDPVPGLLPPVTPGSLCQIPRLQAGHQPGLSPESHIRAGAQPGPTPETRHGEHTGIRSPGINQMPWGTWRLQRSLSTPREEQRKEDTPGSSSTPACRPGSSLPRLVDETRRDARWSLNPTQVCPPLNAAAQSTPEEACVSPRHRAGGLTL